MEAPPNNMLIAIFNTKRDRQGISHVKNADKQDILIGQAVNWQEVITSEVIILLSAQKIYKSLTSNNPKTTCAKERRKRDCFIYTNAVAGAA